MDSQRKQRTTNRLAIHDPPPTTSVASAGYGRTQVAVTHPPSGNAGSTPARRSSQDVTGPFVYRFRTPASHAGKAGSIPARVMRSREQRVERQEPEKTLAANLLSGSRLFTLVSRRFHGQVVQQVDTRRSERRARTGLGVRLSPWSIRVESGELRDKSRKNPGPRTSGLALVSQLSSLDFPNDAGGPESSRVS